MPHFDIPGLQTQCLSKRILCLSCRLQRQLEEEAQAKNFRARQYNPAMFAAVQPRVRRSEPARLNGSGLGHAVNGGASGGRPVTPPKPATHRSDQRHSYRQDMLDGEFNNEAAAARRAMALAREVCLLFSRSDMYTERNLL
jgi:hypothetical protein